MTLDKDDLINSIMASLDRIDFIEAKEIPDIDLYMDQVTKFMEDRLKATTRNPGEDKVMTKTMINNYAKNSLLPPPVKKKYSKEHMFLIIFIYYFKNVLSINDIDKIISPLKSQFFANEEPDGMNVEEVYERIRLTLEGLNDSIKEDVLDAYKNSQAVFADTQEADNEALSMFSFITMLSMDVYVKRLLIEKIIDNYENMKNDDSKK